MEGGIKNAGILPQILCDFVYNVFYESNWLGYLAEYIKNYQHPGVFEDRRILLFTYPLAKNYRESICYDSLSTAASDSGTGLKWKPILASFTVWPPSVTKNKEV